MVTHEMSTLQNALLQNNMEGVKRILESHSELSQAELDCGLETAISGDNPNDLIKQLLTCGAKITDASIYTAAKRGDAVAFQAFVECGWDINSLEFGRPALRRVLANESVVQWFLDHGADPNLRGSKDFSVMSQAVNESSETSLLKLLIDHGAQIDPFELYAAMSPRSRGGGIQVMKFLIDQGVELNTPGVVSRYHYATPLCYAARLQRKDMVQILLDAGADPTIKNYGKTPADIAKEKGCMDIVEILSKGN